MTSIIKKLGSVGFTVLISAGLILLLIISTSLEAVNGTPFAQKMFYNTKWFDLVISLLWINIFCSTLVRFPFKKAHIGFLITHIGILGLLAGALITRTHSIEGEMAVFVGQTADTMIQDGHDLVIYYPNQDSSRFDLKKGALQFDLTKERLNAAVPFCPLTKKARPQTNGDSADLVNFTINEILLHAAEKKTITPAISGPVNHAIKIKVSSKQLAQNSVQWLVEREPGSVVTADTVMLGPIRTILRRKILTSSTVVVPTLRIMDRAGKALISIDITTGALPKKITIPKTRMVIKDLTYFPYASVVDKKIINFPEGQKLNPAVVYFLVDARGVETRQVKFAYYPDFETLPPQGSKRSAELQVRFSAGDPEDSRDLFDGLQVGFSYGDKDLWRYQTTYQNKVLKAGDVTIGNCLSTGWNDVEFCVQELSTHATVTYDIVPTSDVNGPLAVSVSVPASGNDKIWLFEDKLTPVHLTKGDVNFGLEPRMFTVPFSVTLKQFRKIDYPGTFDAAGFESDVILKDQKRGITIERTISMNHPLEYDGFKLFQSSYFTDPQYGQASVFTVARNPGIPWIYISSVLALLGAVILFYWPKKE
ncbi:MAG: cytochrome c biogenesis protein ResB [Candidatus Omnitrophica bacterium]|nr:cytochrome c biogenesis protein ResB [Candidatus Omnitrophota bacterium]